MKPLDIDPKKNYNIITPGYRRRITQELGPTMLGFDYRVEGMSATTLINAGYRDVVVSWRQNDTANARAFLATLRNANCRIWVTIEPWVRTSFADANVKSGWASDDALWDLAEANNGWLRDEGSNITNPVPEFWDDFQNRTRGLDFSNSTFVSNWVGWIHSRWPDISGVYHDYGFPTGGLAWVNGYDTVPVGTWTTWAAGYRAAFQGQRSAYPEYPLALGEYGTDANLNPDVAALATAAIIEGAGPLQSNLFTYLEAWERAQQAMAAGLRPLIWYNASNAQARRLLACMCAATHGYWARRVDVAGALTTPEVQTLAIGTCKSHSLLTTNVWLCQGTRGHIVINLSGSPYVYLGRSVAANDGLMVMEYDTQGRQLTPAQTNVGI